MRYAILPQSEIGRKSSDNCEDAVRAWRVRSCAFLLSIFSSSARWRGCFFCMLSRCSVVYLLKEGGANHENPPFLNLTRALEQAKAASYLALLTEQRVQLNEYQRLSPSVVWPLVVAGPRSAVLCSAALCTALYQMFLGRKNRAPVQRCSVFCLNSVGPNSGPNSVCPSEEHYRATTTEHQAADVADWG
jgi:hypothetical protein